jgi:hypothetical protein
MLEWCVSGKNGVSQSSNHIGKRFAKTKKTYDKRIDSDFEWPVLYETFRRQIAQVLGDSLGLWLSLFYQSPQRAI